MIDKIIDFLKTSGTPTIIFGFGAGVIWIYQGKFSIDELLMILGFIFIAGFIAGYIEYKIKQSIKKNISEEKLNQLIDDIDIQSHSVINMIQHMMINIRTMKFKGCENNMVKEACIKDFLILKYQGMLDFVEDICEELKNNKEKICIGNCGYIQEKIQDMIAIINDNARMVGIPEIFITKFMEFHQPHIEIFWQTMCDICQSRMIKKCYNKTNIHFFNLQNIAGLTIQDAESILGLINGDLDKALNECDYLNLRKSHIDTFKLFRV